MLFPGPPRRTPPWPAVTSRPAADIYGPSEQLIGRYLASHPEQAQRVQVGIFLSMR